MKITVRTIELDIERTTRIATGRRRSACRSHRVDDVDGNLTLVLNQASPVSVTSQRELTTMKTLLERFRSLFALVLGMVVLAPLLVSGPSQSAESIPVESPGAVFVVTTTSDGTGAGTFRTALTSANANPGLDTINFNIPGSGIQNLPLTSALPNVADPVVIDGTTQPGYVAGAPAIRFTPGAGGINQILTITGGGSTVRGLSFASFSGVTQGNAMIELESSGNTVAACASGTGSGNTQVLVTGANNTIGGSTPADRNYFYGNTSSRENVIISGANARGNRVIGNWFGTTPAGVRQTNSGHNIFIDNAPGNFIGGSAGTTPGGACTGQCNVISGGDDAVRISGTGAAGNLVAGNFIGTFADGLNPNRNGSYGVHIVGASNNTIGGTGANARNVIAANFFGNVLIEGTSSGNTVSGNYIQVKTNGSEAVAGTFNVPAFGVQINSSGNTVGGTTAGARNVISGSNRNVILAGSGNNVRGNYIGTDATGAVGLTTAFDGIFVTGANNNIGGIEALTADGPCTGACNVISGNAQSGNPDSHGIKLTGTGATGNVIEGNYIGLNAAGLAPIRNGITPTNAAIQLFNASGNRIGSAAAPARSSASAFNHFEAQLPPFACLQDDKRGDWVEIDRATGEFMYKICGQGGPHGPFQGSTGIAAGIFSLVSPLLTAQFIDQPMGSGAATLVVNDNPLEHPKRFTFVDSNMSDSPCECPPGKDQYVYGMVKLEGDMGSNNNDLLDFFLGVISNGDPLPEPDQPNVRIFNGDGNDIIGCYMVADDAHNIVKDVGTGNSFVDNHYINGSIWDPIELGEPNFSSFTGSYDVAGRLVLTGVIMGQPNTLYRVDVYGVATNTFTGQPIDAQGPLRASFNVTTDANGSASFNHTSSFPSSLLAQQSELLDVTITELLDEQPRAAGDLIAPTGAALGRTLEMPPPVAVTSPKVTISGRVTTPDGRGLRNATVTLQDNFSGTRRTATTSAFGFYSFDLINVYRGYIMSVSSKRFRFSPQTTNVFGAALANVDFTGSE